MFRVNIEMNLNTKIDLLNTVFFYDIAVSTPINAKYDEEKVQKTRQIIVDAAIKIQKCRDMRRKTKSKNLQ